MSTRRPFLVIVPGGSQNPSQYALFAHLLLKAGYPVYTGLLPSVGTTTRVTAAEDTAWVRDHMILPALDREDRDVIIITHSYGAVPGSAACLDLDKITRAKDGKKTGVIGQIHIAGTVHKGGDGKSIVESFGGQYPPHLQVDTENDLMLMADRIPPLYNDVSPEYAEVLAISTVAQGLTALNSPCPLASWSEEAFKGKFAYVITLQDQCIFPPLQHLMLEGSGVEWLTREIDAGHSPQVSVPEELVEIVVELARHFEGL